MAQPVFDGHPLEEYFQDSGEAAELMPGGIADLSLQPYLIGLPSVSRHAERMENLCFLIFGAVQSLSSLFSSDRVSLRTQAFAERFKYGIISSSLLSSSLATTPMLEPHRQAPSLPGKLSPGHSRTPSATDSVLTDCPSLSVPPDPETPIWPVTLSFTISIAAFSARFHFSAILLLAGTLYYIRVHRVDMHSSKPDVMTPSLMALQHLISAGRLWDSVINDTFAILENEERSIFSTPHTPSSSLRVALSTSLLTTQTQCDNVRQLLAAITSPTELVQLAEMYAPPSPIKPTFPRDSRRPLSHPGPSPRGDSTTDRTRKRSTWNGSYASLALAGSPSAFQLAQRRKKRRSDLSALIGTASPCPAPRSALSSPQHLADVFEEEDDDGAAFSHTDDDTFGAAALGLYRRRVHGGLRALELSPQRTTTTLCASKYTRMHPARHPLSLSPLQQALHGALASKRFACAHLLALRFEDDEDEAYWDDVRAVMDLLTTTLADAAARLSEALERDEADARRSQEEALDRSEEEEEGEAHGRQGAEKRARALPTSMPLTPPKSMSSPPLSLSLTHAFAPTPTHLARFAAHVGAIAGALDDARDELARCVAALKDGQEGGSSRPSTASSSEGPLEWGLREGEGGEERERGGGEMERGEEGATSVRASEEEAGDHEHPALHAYARLRRELGLALRECERGRARLVEIVAPLTPTTDEDEDPGDVGVRRVVEKALEREQDSEGVPEPEPVSASAREPERAHDTTAHDDDDATHPLLLATSAAHLPPPGAEQVFEIEAESSVAVEGGSGSGSVVRARSTLTRQERIQRAKAARVEAPEDERRQSPRSRWGPTDDVVQELKDVIDKVGRRRRPS